MSKKHNQIQSFIRKYLKETNDNVIAVSFGQKHVGGESVGTESIIVTVRKKIPEVELSDADLVPSLVDIDGELYSTDVVEGLPMRALTACYDNNDTSVYEIARLQGVSSDGLLTPMRGGQEIFIFPDGWNAYGGASIGTLGFFAIDNEDDRVVGVTNTHVAIANVLYGDDPVRQGRTATVDGIPQEILHYDPFNTIEPRPWPVTGRKYSAGALARSGTDYHHAALNVKKFTPFSTEEYNDTDAACLIMNNGVFLKNNTPFVNEDSYKIWQPSSLESGAQPGLHTDHYPFATTEEIDSLTHAAYGAAGARCYSTGRTTGPKGYCDSVSVSILRVDNVHYTSQVGYGTMEDGTQIAPYFDECISYKSSSTTTWRASLPGDSGSCLLADVYPVDADGDPDTSRPLVRKIIGIVFAGNGVIGLANRIDLVAQRLDIRAWDADYNFSRETSLSLPKPVIITEPSSAARTLTINREEDGETHRYWHSGLTFQQYYAQYAPTDILLSNNVIPETIAGGNLVGLLEAVDPDIYDVFTFSLVSGEGDEDNEFFRIISDQLQVNIPAYTACETDLYWSETVFLLSAQFDCAQSVVDVSLQDKSTRGYPLTAVGNARILDRSLATANSYPSPPEERYAINFNTCGYGYVDTGDASYIEISSTIRLEGDFTIEGWVRPISQTGSFVSSLLTTSDSPESARLNIYLSFPNSNRGMYVTGGINANEYGPYVTDGRSSADTATAVPDIFEWSHVAVTREGEIVRVYLNGTIYDTGTLAGEITLENPRLFNDSFGGYFTDFRITRSARYTGTGYALPYCPAPTAGPISFDYETKNEYSIRVSATDSGNRSFEKQFTIYISDEIEYAPTDIILTYAWEPVFADQPLSEPIGTFTVVDEDANDVHTYTLVPGTGDTDNALFSITSDKLYRAGTLTSPTATYPVYYSIRVRAEDLGGFSFTKVFTIEVLAPPPTPIAVFVKDNDFAAAPSNVENTVSGSVDVAAGLREEAEAINELEVLLVDGPGSDENSLFVVDNDVTRTDNTAPIALVRAAQDISFADLPAATGYFRIRLRVRDTVTNRSSDITAGIYLSSPQPPYAYITNAFTICPDTGGTTTASTCIGCMIPEGDTITAVEFFFDPESTFSDMLLELSNECGGTDFQNEMFTVSADPDNNRWLLKAASHLNFVCPLGQSNCDRALNICYKVTDTRTGLAEIITTQIYTRDCPTPVV